MFPSQFQSSLPVFLFQITGRGLQLLNCQWQDLRGLTPNRWLGISLGGWRSLIPQEYHSEVEKLSVLPLSESYTVVEFPVYWQDNTIWLLVFAAAVDDPESGRKIVGLVQDVTPERERSFALSGLSGQGQEYESRPPQMDSANDSEVPAPAESIAELCHDLSGPVTSILVNCEMLMEDDCPPPVRQKLEGILSEAMHINQHLRSHRRA
jgi:hypothetical protein